ncbi:MAG: Amuc_1099 family pilus-like system protein [Akkermansiaceae bacterium]
MSWISENYEKAALGGAAVIALGLGALIWSNNDKASGAFDFDQPKQNHDASVAGLEAMMSTNESFTSTQEVIKSSVNGRKVDLFTSVPVYVKRGDLSNSVDLGKDGDVHQGIENSFWLKYGLDPTFDNSPQLDPDGDGFSNQEEYTAGTSPVNYESYPELVLKLSVVSVDTVQLHIKPSAYSGKSTFRLENKKGNRLNKMGLEPITPGAIIPFNDEYMQGRFKFVATKGEGRNMIWVIEDLQLNKKGKVYEFDRKGNMQGAPDREFGIMDSKVTFELKALDQKGKTFIVEENNRFSLPYSEASENQSYLFKSIDLVNKIITIEYKNKEGLIKTHPVKF